MSLCQGGANHAQKQHYRAVALAKKENNSSCVPEPLEHPNSWEIGGLSVSTKWHLKGRCTWRAHKFSLPAFPRISGPPSSHLLLMQGSHHSFYSSFFSILLQALLLWPLLFCLSSYHPTHPQWEKTKGEREIQRDILLASMRKPETGRGSEQCQQIREVQKPLQEACQSSSITGASETQKNTRTANCAGMSSLAAKGSQAASDKTMAICSALFWDHT